MGTGWEITKLLGLWSRGTKRLAPKTPLLGFYRYQQVAGGSGGWFPELEANLYFDMKWTE